MSLSTLRKSGRIKTRKKTKSHMSDDFEYDENKFDPDDDSNVEIQTKSNVDISTDISHLLHSHSKETNDENACLNHSSFPNVMSKLQTEDVQSLGENLLEDCGGSGQIDEGQIFSCDICGKMLVDIASYDRHMKSHSSDRRFQCGQCDKAFLDSCSLKRHMKTHEDDRPFSCEICQKSFRDTGSISRHMLTHTERPRMFQCSICDKNFTDKTGLKRHEKTHTGLRPFVCDVCQKAFMDSCSFKRHQKIHIGIKNYHCRKCKRSFMEKQSLVRHQKTVCKFLDDSSERGGNVDSDDLSNPNNDSSLVENKKRNIDNYNEGFLVDEESKDHSNHSISSGNSNSNSLSASTLPTSQTSFNNFVPSDNLSSSDALQRNKSPIKGQPSLGSLIKKDPGLYDSISEIVESIDSYEKMLDLCGDQGQKEIDAALTRDPVPMPNNLLCFECGELLVDGVNFKSDGKVFHPTMTNAFKCLSCEADEEGDDEEYGEPPVLMPHGVECSEDMLENDNIANEITPPNAGDAIATENFYGTDEPMEQFQDRLKKEHGVYFIEDGFQEEESSVDDGSRNSFSHPVSKAEDDQSNSSFTPGFPNYSKHQTPGRSKISQHPHLSLEGQQQQQSPNSSTESANTTQMCPTESGEQPKFDYEVDDPTTSIPSVFPCHLCTKVFASAPFLSQHLSLHKKSPHKCMVCTKSFTSAPALKRHMHMHTGEKPYVCPICQKQFRDPSNYGKHKKNCIGSVGVSSRIDSTASSPPQSNLEDSFSMDNFNQPSSDPSVERGEIQTMGKRKNKKAKAGGGNNKGRKYWKVKVFGNAKCVDVLDETAPSVSEVNNHNNTADFGESDLSGVADESFPIMAVMPSLDDDDDIDDQSVRGDESGVRNIFKDESTVEDDKEVKGVVDDNGGKDVGDENNFGGENGDKKMNYIACEVCQKLCENRDHLEMHMNYHTGNPNITCIECGKTFADSFGMKRHMRTHLGIRPYACEICGRGYCDNWSLKKHRSKGCVKSEVKVALEGLFSCPKCLKVFGNEENFQVHVKMHKGMIPNKFECDVCHKGFSEAFNLKKHRRLHMAICSSCGQEFDNIKLLKTHQELADCTTSKPAEDTVDTDKSFSCEICGRVYSTRSYLDRHRKIHSGVKPHACEICNKRFSEAFKLRRHQKSSHSDEKPFMCQDCGKCFSDDEALKRHTVSSACALNKVMGETVSSENCACQFCDKVFQKSYMLVRHMAVHSQSRPFACEICGRSYKDTSSLKRHQVTHVGVKNYICPTCGTDFFYSDSLKRHMSGRCGRKTKTRRRKAVPWNRPKKRYSKKTVSINDGLPVDNYNDDDESTVENYIDTAPKSWKRKLHTSPYIPTIISELPTSAISIPPTKKKKGGEGKWSCHSKEHCWLCDVKAPTASALLSHRKRVHNSNNQKQFSCRKCFLRFRKKIYWRAHVFSRHQVRQFPFGYSGSNGGVTKVSRRRTVASTDDIYSSVLMDNAYELSLEDISDAKRPRRSVPRAKWSWISQI